MANILEPTMQDQGLHVCLQPLKKTRWLETLMDLISARNFAPLWARVKFTRRIVSVHQGSRRTQLCRQLSSFNSAPSSSLLLKLDWLRSDPVQRRTFHTNWRILQVSYLSTGRKIVGAASGDRRRKQQRRSCSRRPRRRPPSRFWKPTRSKTPGSQRRPSSWKLLKWAIPWRSSTSLKVAAIHDMQI
jgi:hypothetical protein